MTTRILTGITTTGTPHLGNYAGAIRPAIRASQSPQPNSNASTISAETRSARRIAPEEWQRMHDEIRGLAR